MKRTIKSSLTEKQKRVLDFISSFSVGHGYAPSLKEIGDFLDTKNLSTAQHYIKELSEKGFLERLHHKRRGIVLKTPFRKVQLLGSIVAGEPMEALENPEPIEVPPHIKIDERHPHYALKVKGDSMMDMGVLDGDIMVVKHQMTADNGDIVVAVTEKGATLKVLRKKGGQVFLEPRSGTHKPIYPKQLEIRGVFVGLMRGQGGYNG